MKKVLLVEDNRDLLESMEMLLAGHFFVETAEDGQQALELLGRSRPDIIVSDIMMPEMNGYELLKKVRSMGEFKDVPVVLLTALGQDENLIGGYELGADDYLVKPVRAEVLIARLNNLLRKQAEMRSLYNSNPEQNTDLPVKDPVLAMLDSLVIKKYKFKNFTIPQLAGDMGLSYVKLDAQVKEKAQMTPVKYINEIKLKKAMELLVESGMPIKDIAFKLGFRSLSYFGKCYKARFGVTPSDAKSNQ